MSSNSPEAKHSPTGAIGTVLIIAVVGAAVFMTQSYWRPYISPAASEDDPHAGHDHDAHSGAHSDVKSVKISEKGLKNIGFKAYAIALTDFERTLTLPAIVVERPGRSQLHITAPLTGVVTAIHAVNGEAVHPGDLLFELRLTHEELVAAQKEYLATSANLEIVVREIQRLKGLGIGVVAGKRILEKEYEKQKLEVDFLSLEQAMLLHGLSKEQVTAIQTSKQLFRSIKVHAPDHTEEDEACDEAHLLTIQSLKVAKGEQVEVGRELAVLADHCELHVEALAFEDDAASIRKAILADKPVMAHLLKGNTTTEIVGGLELLYVASQIDSTSRAMKVYLSLPNQVALDRVNSRERHFIEWRYKPGQRMQISIPVETWRRQIVVPAVAIVEESAESYVYRQNGNQFDRVAVHVLHRTQNQVVISNDGTLFPGDQIAGNGAYLIHLTLKNQSGGAIDPHAGHNH